MREWGFQKAAPKRQCSQSKVGDQRAWGQTGDRIQPTVQENETASRLTWDWTEMAI